MNLKDFKFKKISKLESYLCFETSEVDMIFEHKKQLITTKTFLTELNLLDFTQEVKEMNLLDFIEKYGFKKIELIKSEED